MPPQEGEPDNEPEEGEGSGGGTGQDEGDPGEDGSEQDTDDEDEQEPDGQDDEPAEDDEPGDQNVEDQESDPDSDPDGTSDPGESQEDESTDSSCEVIPVEDEDEQKEQEAEWQGALVQAESAAKGNLPGDLKRMVDEVMAPDLPWHVLLRDFVEQTAKNDFNWGRANRRFLAMDLHMPSLLSEELPEIVIAIDTSGSIDRNRLNTFAAEASNVLEQYDTTARVIYCDTQVNGEDVFERQNLPLKMNPIGGGGTDFRPVFEYIRTNGYDPACVIFFTDMWGTFPEQECEWPTLWVTESGSPKAPWGQTVEF